MLVTVPVRGIISHLQQGKGIKKIGARLYFDPLS
jgi:hypothetical protein